MYGSKIENLLKIKDVVNVPEFEIIKWENRNNVQIDTNYKGKYAVRSATNIEDGKMTSFAGQFDTYLNVESKDLKEKINDCFNSINNQNVKDYLKKQNITEEIKMDVIVQKMINSELSGIIFTSNPKGLLNETVIVVGKGLGNNIVEDKIDTTTYYYNKTDNIYYFEGKEEYLNKEQIDEIITTSKKINEILGENIDIEFAIENNTLYILQARPITTLNTNNLVILDNSNIVESYPGISSPLTISFVKYVYSGVFKGVASRILQNEKILNKYLDNINNMVSSSNARIYYKISNWYTIIKFLPLSSKIIPIWQDMLGVKIKIYDKEKIKLSPIARIKTYINTIKNLKNAPKNMDKLNKDFIEIDNFFYDNFNENLTNKEVKKLFDQVREKVLANWDITLINDLYSFIYTGLLKKRLKKLDSNQINDYISGISNIESLKPIKNLINLAYEKDKLTQEEYQNKFNEYIRYYGDRNLEELKLESKTFRTDKTLLEEKINEYRKDLDKLETIHENINKEKTLEIKQDFITKKIAKKAMIGIKNREISRLNRSRIFGMVRSMFIQIGKNLEKENKLDNYQDIFYLTMDEIFEEKKDFKPLIKERKEEYKIYKELPNYSRLIFTEKEFDKNHKSVNLKKLDLETNKLQGTGTSNGITEGYALVIDDITKKYDVKNKILITKMTDPGWVFLLATAKGVISEKGSILSHTAIISRELKIPSIVGVEKATSIIKTGDYIKMDGTTGKIEIKR